MEQSKFYQIKNITEHEYILVGCDGSIITRPIRDIDKTATAFTIQDAKDGDVLSYREGQWIFIYKGFGKEENEFAYYALLSDEGLTLNNYNYSVIENAFSPVTKEQRDTLMKAMADAGYTFDFEKKELKKIEQKPTWSEEDENRRNRLIAYFECKESFTAEDDIVYANWLKSLRPQNRWKESLATADLENSLCDIQDAFSDTSYEYRILGEAIEFIRCTEPKPQWKPSDEQMVAVQEAMNIVGILTITGSKINSLYQDLKKLREK